MTGSSETTTPPGLSPGAGQRLSFDDLVERYQLQVYNLALRMLHDAQAAEDITQDVFFTAYRRLDTLRGDNPRAWLLRIATNACYDHLRARSRRPTSSLDSTPAGETAMERPDTGESPEEAALRGERERVIALLLAQVPADYRLVLILSDLQGLSYEEISEAVGVGLGTVKSRLSRGRARMRDLLRGHRELFPLVQRLTDEGSPR